MKRLLGLAALALVLAVAVAALPLRVEFALRMVSPMNAMAQGSARSEDGGIEIGAEDDDEASEWESDFEGSEDVIIEFESRDPDESEDWTPAPRGGIRDRDKGPRSRDELQREVELERQSLEELRQRQELELEVDPSGEIQARERELRAHEERLQRLESRIQRDRVIRRRDGDREAIIIDHKGSLVRMGQDVVVARGETVDEVVVIGGNLEIMGEVDGDAVAIGGDVDVGPGGWVMGDAVSIGGVLDIHPGGLVEGSRIEVGHFAPIFFGRLLHGPGFDFPGHGFSFLRGVLSLLVVLFVGWLAVLLFGERLSAMADIAQLGFGRSILMGILVIVLWPPAMILAAITVIGIPVAILLALLVPLALFVGYLIGAMAFGRRVATGIRFERSGALAHLLTGLVAIGILWMLGEVFAFVPFLGLLGLAFKIVAWVITTFAALTGLGALTTGLLGDIRARRASPPPPPGGGVPAHLPPGGGSPPAGGAPSSGGLSPGGSSHGETGPEGSPAGAS